MRISQQIAIIAWWHAIFEKVQWKNASPPHFSLKLIEFFWCALNPSRLEKSFVVCTSKPKLLELFCTFSHDKRYKTYLGLIMDFFNIRSKRFMPIEKRHLLSSTTQQIFKRFNIYQQLNYLHLWKKSIVQKHFQILSTLPCFQEALGYPFLLIVRQVQNQ